MNFVQLQIGMMMGETGKAQVSVLKNNKADDFRFDVSEEQFISSKVYYTFLGNAL